MAYIHFTKKAFFTVQYQVDTDSCLPSRKEMVLNAAHGTNSTEWVSSFYQESIYLSGKRTRCHMSTEVKLDV